MTTTRTTCRRGHKLEGDNAYRRANGKVECRTCTNARARARDRNIAHDDPRLQKGLGVVRCAICDQPVATHSVTRPCR